MPMEEDHRLYIPSQPHIENIVYQPFAFENNSETSTLGPEVNAWQELWHDDSCIYLIIHLFLKGQIEVEMKKVRGH